MAWFADLLVRLAPLGVAVSIPRPSRRAPQLSVVVDLAMPYVRSSN